MMINSSVKKSIFVIFVLYTFNLNQAQAFWDPIDKLLNTDLPIIIGQEPNDLHGSHEEFKDYCENDKSNDDIGTSTSQQIILRSGYNYETHYSMSDDGYITELIRVINPDCDQRYLKQPPVMLLHGGTIDTTAYVWASAIQHRPEPYPRTEESGPMVSWNRSLAFMLANNGYDVWLIGTRGSDSKNEGHIKYKEAKSIDKSGESQKQFIKTPVKNAIEAREFWSFTMDDIIQYEVPRQIDRVLSITGARKVMVHSYSQSTLITLTMLSENPAYADKVHALVSMAPVINDIGSNRFSQYAIRFMCGLLPLDVGITLFSEVVLTQTTRNFFLKINEVKYLRYHFIKPLLNVLYGSSAKWLTLLEPSVMGHSLMPVGFGQLKQSCQQVMAKQFQKYDYGPIQNGLRYGAVKPPKVNLTDLHIDHWLVVSGSRDNFAPPASVEQILSEVVYPKPYKHVIAEGFNHLDMVAAVTNDIYVNIPILEFFDQVQLPPLESSEPLTKKSTEEDKELDKFVPKLQHSLD